MKKVLSILMIFAILLMCVACSSGSSTGEQPAQSSDTQESVEQPAEEEKPKELAYTIENEIIVDNEYCALTVLSGEVKKSGAPEFKLQMENKTADKTLMFSIDNVSVNGWMMDPFFASSVAPGKKSNDTLSFTGDDFKACGLTSADEISFDLRVYDSDDWMADNYVEDSFVIYPTGLTAEEVVIPERRAGANEMVIEDNDAFTFIILDTDPDNFWGYTLNAYLENKTDNTIMFSWDDVSVNGFMVDPFWATSVAPGSRKISEVNFSDSKLEENGIETVEDVEFGLRVYNYEDWLTDDIFKGTFTYNPE